MPKAEPLKNEKSEPKHELSPQKRKAVDLALFQIEKEFGKGAVMKMGDVERVAVETIPTGSISLDLAIGGGVPRGRIIEIYGPESSGKTTLASHIVAEAQRLGGLAAFIDVEHAFDPEYARKIGVDIDNLLMSQPDHGEQALEIVETLVRSNAVDIIVIDSVSALVPKAEIDGDMGDLQPGAQARLMSKALRKLTSVVSKSKTCVIFINQLRMKIGIMFGNPETTSGGNALKFYASVRLDIRRTDKLEDGTGNDRHVVGNRVRVKVVKNKIAPPARTAEFDILFNRGISIEGDILDLGVKLGLIVKSGAFYSIGGEQIGQGRDKARAYFAEHPKVMADMKARILELSKGSAIAALVEEANDE